MMKINLMNRPIVYICPPSNKYEKFDKHYCRPRNSLGQMFTSKAKLRKDKLENYMATLCDRPFKI